MKVKEIMERCGMNSTGRAVAYIKDALAEINTLTETHVKNSKKDIIKDQRFYDLPLDMVKITDVRCKHQGNNSGKYQSIPRTIYEPRLEDEDGL